MPYKITTLHPTLLKKETREKKEEPEDKEDKESKENKEEEGVDIAI